jgi:hypothetical protein
MVAPFGRRLPGVLPLRVLRRRIHRLKTRVRVRQLRKADTDNPPLHRRFIAGQRNSQLPCGPTSSRVVHYRPPVSMQIRALSQRVLPDCALRAIGGKSRRAQTPLPAAPNRRLHRHEPKCGKASDRREGGWVSAPLRLGVPRDDTPLAEASSAPSNDAGRARVLHPWEPTPAPAPDVVARFPNAPRADVGRRGPRSRDRNLTTTRGARAHRVRQAQSPALGIRLPPPPCSRCAEVKG